MVTSNNVIHAALYLVVTLTSVGAAYLLLAAEFLAWVQILIYVGALGVLARRTAGLVLMSIELMLSAVHVNLVACSQSLKDALAGGQIFALFVITVAAAEIGIGLAIVILICRNRETIDVDQVSLLKW